jgi:RimJ/RimL family protein N-acetyltransferase
MTLKTARLTMQPFRLQDADDLFGIRGDREAMQHWDWPHDENAAATGAIAERILEDMRASKAFYWTARTSDGTFAGLFDLSELTEPTPDLGFMVPRRLWGKGYGFEAARAVVSEAWDRKIPALKARIHEGNNRSAGLLIKLGFVEELPASQIQVRPDAAILCRHFRLLASTGVERHRNELCA